MKKKYITVAQQFGSHLLAGAGSAAGQLLVTEAYNRVKNHLVQRNIPHNIEEQHHHSALSYKGGYISIYYENYIWYQVNH